MKNVFRSFLSLFVLTGLLSGAALGQNRVLAYQGGYQLTEADLVPSVELLNFLIQDQLSQNEIIYLAQHSAHEFQKNPGQFVQDTQQLKQLVNQLKAMNDPMKAAELRAEALAEAAGFVQNRPYQEWPAAHQLLFKRAPVVAQDPNTGLVLTEQDLTATLTYLGMAQLNQGQSVTEQDLQQAALQIASGFQDLDRNSQMVLSSGTILLQLYQQYPQAMASAPQHSLNHARTTTGGPPTSNNNQAYSNYSDAARHRAVNQQAMQFMYDNMNQNHATMMNFFENDPSVEWTYTPSGGW